ncbi:MAG TPA: hypothetical protein VFY90_02945, partial [Tepidiformaceae bacterium]|nr:hypothetical protein [Tepidiformaceae bacterium]
MRRLWLVVAVLGVCVALTGCSPVKRSTADLAATLAKSAQAAEDQGTVRIEVRIRNPGPDEREFSKTTGVIDFRQRRSSVSAQVQGQTVDAIYDEDGRYYMSGQFENLGFGKWLLIDFGAAGLAGSYGPMMLPDPTKALDVLRAGAKSIEDAGKEDVRGVSTEHYRLTVEMGTIYDAWGFGEELKGAAQGDVNGPAVVDAWLDSDDLVRRLSYEMRIYGDGEWKPYTITLEFWDYGKAPDVELPSPDDVMDFSEWVQSFAGDSGGSIEEDYFAGAECYGDRLDDCLQPNPEVDATAAHPTTCQGDDARVCLVPMGNVRADVVRAIVDFHRDTAAIDVVVLPSLPLQEGWLDRETSQVDATSLYEGMQAAYGVGDDSASTFIALTPVDIKPRDGGYPWMFGQRYGKGVVGNKHGVFSYFRMANVEPYDGEPLSDELLHLRAAKYAGRYTALLYLQYSAGDDIAYLNYGDMYGFSDLDSMGTRWPEGASPCMGNEPVICIIPDGEYDDEAFYEDLKAAVSQLGQDLGMRVEIRRYGGHYYPTEDSWSEEFRNDLYTTFGGLIARRNVTVIGVTDDELAQ